MRTYLKMSRARGRAEKVNIFLNHTIKNFIVTINVIMLFILMKQQATCGQEKESHMS